MRGRPALSGGAFLVAAFLHLALALAPTENEGGGCAAGDETGRLLCQLHEAKKVISQQSFAIEDKSAKLEQKEALIKDMEARLARMEALVKDTVSAPDEKDATIKDQDAQLARMDAPIEEPVRSVAESGNKRALTEANIPDAWQRSDKGRDLTEQALPPGEQHEYPGPAVDSYLSNYMFGQEHLDYPDMLRSGHLSPYMVEKEYSPVLSDLGDYVAHEAPSGRQLGTTDLPTLLAALPSNTTRIDFSWWGLTGTVPAEIGRFSNVEYLDLSYNSLTGTIPPEIGSLSKLQRIYLSRNQLYGTIPPEMGKLTQLVSLGLFTNKLTGTLSPELCNLLNIRYLDPSGNGITGTIPPCFGNFSRALKWLYLSGNALTGTIPPELGNLTQLNTLGLDVNALTGTIPPELGNLTQLTDIWLAYNGITGTIPPQLGKLTKLVSMWLDYNAMTGTIPPEFGKLSALMYIGLDNNKLTGTIPPELGNMTKITKIYFNSNMLQGTIPPELGNLTLLTFLDLDTNALTGIIPPNLGSLALLQSLYLNSNYLRGTIPTELGKLSQLGRLYLHTNVLAGTIPNEIGKLSKLTMLALYKNQLSGTIPPELCNLTQLTIFNLRSNLLTGTVPPDVGNLRQVVTFDVSSNRLTGTLPNELGSLVNLTSLTLAGNDFSGTLPSSIGQLKALQTLDVSDNRGITGAFPDTRNTSLRAISAANCGFTSAGAVSGTVKKIFFANNNLTDLPADWVNLTGVLQLDISNNQISRWRPYGVFASRLMYEGTYPCEKSPQLGRLNWPVIQSVKLSGNPIGLSISLHDFVWSVSYLTTLSELFAAGCQLQGVVQSEELVRSFGVDLENTGPCPVVHPLPSIPVGFQGLLTLDLSANNITAILPPPPPRLSMAILHSNPLVELGAGWYNGPNNLEVWNDPFLRASVVPPDGDCSSAVASTLEADPRGFVTNAQDDAFQCTTLCAGVKTRYKHDASLNASSLCRCLVGRQGAGTNCSGCPADTYSYANAEDKWAMVRTCRPCPARSQTDYVVNATGIDQCKCQAGWYMETPAAGAENPFLTPVCKRCKQGRFMDTFPGATQESQCVCNPEYDGLRALLGVCGCADGLYMDHAARRCRQCDEVAEECSWGSMIELSLLPPVIRPSYWAAPPPDVDVGLEDSTFSKHDIWRCFSKDTCLGNSVCAVGRSGTACSLCKEGMYGGPDGPCQPCPLNPEDTRKNLLLGILIGPAATIAAHTLLNYRSDKLNSMSRCLASIRTSGKQLMKYLQMLGVMAGFNIAWPPMAIKFLNQVSRVTVALPQVAGVACLTGQQTATLEMGFRWLMPVAGLLSACFGALLVAPTRFLGRESRFYIVYMSFWDVLRVSLWGLALFYSTMLQFGTQVLACTPGPNKKRTVVTFPHLQCGDTEEWAQLAVISCAFLLVFVGAVFLGIYAAWRRATHALVESDFQTSGWWGFLFDDYRAGWGHWLMVTMAKDAALVIIATAGASDGPGQLLATAALANAYSYVVLRDQPFQNPSNNIVEAWTMMSVAVLSVFTAGMGFQKASGVSDVTDLFTDGAADPEYMKRERALLIVQCLTFVGPAGVLLYQFLCASERARKRLPPSVRPPTQEEREKWNREFIEGLKLDEATAADLWRMMHRFDLVDQAKFRDLMSTSTATLGIVPDTTGVNIKSVVRKRFADAARNSKTFKARSASSLGSGSEVPVEAARTTKAFKAAHSASSLGIPSSANSSSLGLSVLEAPLAEVLDGPAAAPAKDAEDEQGGKGHEEQEVEDEQVRKGHEEKEVEEQSTALREDDANESRGLFHPAMPQVGAFVAL